MVPCIVFASFLLLLPSSYGQNIGCGDVGHSWGMEHLLEIIPNVTVDDNMFRCPEICMNTPDCVAMTWYGLDGVNYPENTCILFKSTGVKTECVNCMSVIIEECETCSYPHGVCGIEDYYEDLSCYLWF
eukprot:TRINITY_DN16846_c0_g1_i1.p1 TRINITY_DN16846_c0_g1~~TRINITY_DN16846_c0_g1_i1.p1  ORF type:complete len:129 (-),score=28.13 TRINITY_DN16846_c0_g1_i1:185-571(-)